MEDARKRIRRQRRGGQPRSRATVRRNAPTKAPEGQRAQEARADRDRQGQGVPDPRGGQRANAGGRASSERMDDWLSAFADEGIDIVDAPAKVKVVDNRADEADEAEEGDAEVDGEGRRPRRRKTPTATPPPAIRCGRTCARWGRSRCSRARARSRSPSASRTATGASCRWCLSSSVAIEEILGLGDKLRKHEIRVKEVVQDVDEEDPEFDQQWHVDRICKVIDKVRRLGPDRRAVSSRRSSTPSWTCDCNKKQIDKIVVRLKEFVERVAQARREIAACEDEVGLSRRSSSRRCARSARRRCASGRSPRSSACAPDEIEEMSQVIASAREEDQEGRGRGRADGERPARDRAARSWRASAPPRRPRRC